MNEIRERLLALRERFKGNELDDEIGNVATDAEAEIERLQAELFAVAGQCTDGEPLPSCRLCGMCDDLDDEGFERCQVTLRRIPDEGEL